MLNCIENVLGVLTWIAPLALNPLSLFTLCMAIYFHIYYWYEKQVGDYRTDSLTLVRHLSKVDFNLYLPAGIYNALSFSTLRNLTRVQLTIPLALL